MMQQSEFPAATFRLRGSLFRPCPAVSKSVSGPISTWDTARACRTRVRAVSEECPCPTRVGHRHFEFSGVSVLPRGQAIVYDPPYTPSTCFGSKDKGVMISKAHSSLFANGAACGRRYRVRCLSGTNKAIRDACTGNTVDVMIVGRCEACAINELVLSKEAFTKIARLALGRVNIEYQQI